MTIIQYTKIGDRVWSDSNGNGVQDGGELGKSGVTVQLFDSANNPKGTTTTDANGIYTFTVAPGSYYVHVTAPSGYVFSPTGAGTATTDSDPNPTTGKTATFTVTSGQVDKSWDAGLYRSATIGDRVWEDSNGNGVQDGGELGKSGVAVQLFDSANNPKGTTTTDVNGIYTFTVAPGSYYVQVTAPSGYVFSPTGAGTATTDSDPNPATGKTATFTVTSGQVDKSWDAGLVGTGAIGDFVWVDLDMDGIQDGGEPGIADVALNLYDSTGALIRTTTTDSNGVYTFTNVASGTYTVEVAPAEFSLNQTLFGWDASPVGQGGDPAKDSNGSATLHQASVTVAANTTNTTIDFGFFGSGKSSLGDYVWYDANADGDHQGSEAEFGSAGIDGVLIKLYLDDGDGVFEPGSNGVNGQDRIWGVRTTGPKPSLANSHGWYEFSIVGDGRVYWAYVDPSNFALGGPLSGMIFTNNDNPYQNANPQYVAEPGIVIHVTNVDFGYVHGGAIGDFVWYDSNRDGIQDVGEPGIPNVTLDLYKDTDGTPGLNTATDTKMASTVTDADGGYVFTGLGPGTYYVDVTDANGKLTGLDHIVANQSQPDPTGPIVLTGGTVYKDADFGYVHPDNGKAIVGDTVWIDANGDGIQQPGEPGIPGVTVNIRNSGGTIIGSADTDANGRYFVQVDPGSGYTASPDPADIPAGLTITVTPNPHVLPTLVANQKYLDADFGYNGPNLHVVGDLVWNDADNSGAVNGGELGLPGVSVDLIRDSNNNDTWDAGEPIIATVTTDTDGGYHFTGVPDGEYLVHVSDTNAALSNYVKTKLGTAGANNNNQADPYAITLAAGADNLTADFGYRKVDPKLGQIGNQVWIE